MRFIRTVALSLCFATSPHAQEAVPETAPAPAAPAVATPQTPPDNSAPEVAKYELRWRPTVGELHVMRLSVEQKVSAGPGQQLTQKMELDYALQVLALGEDGSFTASNTFRAVRFNRVAPGIKQSFDSARPAKDLPGEFKTYTAMAGAKITFRFSNRGVMLEVLDTEDFYNRIYGALGIKTSDRAVMESTIKNDTASDQSFRNIGNTIASFPVQAIAMGGSWPKMDPVMSNENLIYDGVCTLKSVTGKIARIEIKSQIKPDATKKLTATEKASPMSGTQTGWYDIELDSGWTTGALLTQTMKAKMLANGQMVGPNAKGAGTPFNLNSTFKLRTLGVKRPQ